jgi:hypothetical protein
MRFRLGGFGNALLWMGLAAFQVAMTTARFRRHMADHPSGSAWVDADIVAICIWILLFVLYFIQVVFSRLELRGDSLRIRRGFSTRVIPYESIVAIRPAKTDGGRPIRNAVEFEIANLGAAIYPHEYLVVPASDIRSFATAMHEKVPQAEYLTT